VGERVAGAVTVAAADRSGLIWSKMSPAKDGEIAIGE
jgi:hypothetical protein